MYEYPCRLVIADEHGRIDVDREFDPTGMFRPHITSPEMFMKMDRIMVRIRSHRMIEGLIKDGHPSFETFASYVWRDTDVMNSCESDMSKFTSVPKIVSPQNSKQLQGIMLVDPIFANPSGNNYAHFKSAQWCRPCFCTAKEIFNPAKRTMLLC